MSGVPFNLHFVACAGWRHLLGAHKPGESL
jgi:hypothetical protein